MFPVPVEALDGQRVLLIALVAAEPRNAYFVTGKASWSGERLRIAYDASWRSAEPTGTAAAWRGFDPRVLPTILLPDAWRRIEPLARDVAACVASWLAEPPRSALVISDAFFGMASNRDTGEIFLMEVDPFVMDQLSSHPDRDSAT